MHISLDSALGRDQRLNSLGETINSIAAPAAAYSLRSLTGGDPRAVRVRRTIDDSEQDFTVSGINSGALVDFVTSGNGVFQNTGYESFSNASASGFTASNTGSTGFAVSDLPDGSSGTAISVSFDIDITNGSPSLSLRNALSGGTVASNTVIYTSSGSKTAILTATENYVGVGFTEGDAPSNFTVSNFKILGDGFVETWYDQSGNGKDATQTTASNQPQIVSSGALVVDSAGLPEIDFDGSDDHFDIDFGSNLSQPNSILFVHQSDSTGDTNNEFFDEKGGSIRTLFDVGSNKYRPFSGAVVDTGIAIDTNKNLAVAVFNGSSSLFAKNGTATSTINIGTNAIAQTSSIGFSEGTGNNYNGTMQEFIIYNSDQTANRTAIETNINSHYSIF